MRKIFDKKSYEELGSPADLAIPEGVKEIGHDAFSGCTSLKAVTLLNPKVMIDRPAFERCTGITTVNLPEGLT